MSRAEEMVYLRGFGKIGRDNESVRFNKSKKAKKSLAHGTTPIPGHFRGRPCDFSEDELWFDPKNQEIVELRPVSLSPLSRAGLYAWENGESN
jgi:hypothetical protein